MHLAVSLSVYGREGRNGQLNQGGNTAAGLGSDSGVCISSACCFGVQSPLNIYLPRGSALGRQWGRRQAPQRLGQGTHADAARSGATGELLGALTAGLGGTHLWPGSGGGFFRWDRLKEVTRGWHEACRLWTGQAEWTAGCCCCQSRA